MSALSDEEKKAIAKNQAYIDANREEILKKFAPAFCFHSAEDSFPMDPNDYIQQVVLAKYNHYTNSKKPLKAEELNELTMIQKYFMTPNGNYKSEYGPGNDASPEDKKEYEALLKSKEFLTFDEKKYGYPIGSKVKWTGIHPKRSKGAKAPSFTSIIATPDGFQIKYENFYAISSAIPGTKWLYKLLPHAISKKLGHFAVHAGDWEGVEVKGKIDPETGKASVVGMQTFAHGRDGARFVEAKDLTYNKDGHPCAFVAQATHASYADNFVLRNRFFDKTGHKHEFVPDTFVNLGADAKKEDLPRWAGFERMGNSSSMQHAGTSYAKDFVELREKSTDKGPHDRGWDRYKPLLGLTKLWHKACAKLGIEKRHEPFEGLQLSAPKEGKVSVSEVAQEKTHSREHSHEKATSHAEKHRPKSEEVKPRKRSSSWKESLTKPDDGPIKRPRSTAN